MNVNAFCSALLLSAPWPKTWVSSVCWALVKVAGTGEKRVEALRLADVFKARVVDATITSFVFEITGQGEELDRFIGLMAELGLVGDGVNQYQLWLGGTPNLSRLAEPYLERLPLEQLESTIEPLLLSWKAAGGRRSLGDHVAKLGREQVEALLARP